MGQWLICMSELDKEIRILCSLCKENKTTGKTQEGKRVERGQEEKMRLCVFLGVAWMF